MEANAASDYHPKAKIRKCEEIMEIRGLRTREVARYRHLYDILDCDDSLKLPSMKTNFHLGLKKSNLKASKASEHPRSGEKEKCLFCAIDRRVQHSPPLRACHFINHDYYY